MVRATKNEAAQKSKPASPMTDGQIEAFLTELDEARQYRDDLERVQIGLSPTEVIVKRANLPIVRKQVGELERQLLELRGDFLTESQGIALGAKTAAAKPDGRMKIQAEAFEHWIRLKASGANPTIHSICETMATWCADNGVTTHTGVTPRAGTIRNTILGGSSGWAPPTHSRDEAKMHIAQLAQLAQPSETDPV